MVHGSKVEPRPEDINFARSCGESQNGQCPTAQSGSAHGGDSSRAVDNAGFDGSWNSASCTHTPRGASPWWRVDMKKAVQVASLTVVGRSDCCSERTQGFSVYQLPHLSRPFKHMTCAVTYAIASTPVVLTSCTSNHQIYVGDYGSDKISENKACVTNQPALPAGGTAVQITCETPIIGRYGSSFPASPFVMTMVCYVRNL